MRKGGIAVERGIAFYILERVKSFYKVGVRSEEVGVDG